MGKADDEKVDDIKEKSDKVPENDVPVTTPTKPPRRHDLDWIRVLATLGVIVFHATRMFDPMGWEVKNNTTADVLMLFNLLWAQWMMPIFFTVSGASIFYSMGFRSPGQLVKAKFVRIMIPFLIVGVFVLSPPQEYIKVTTQGIVPAETTFAEFYPEFVSPSNFSTPSPFYIGFNTFHLWYLYQLFVFSVIMLPLFSYLRSEAGEALVTRLASYFERSWTIYLLALPITLVTSLVHPNSQAGMLFSFGGWAPVAFPVLMLYGFLIVADERFEKAIEAQGRNALVLALVFYVGVVYLFMQLELEGIIAAFGTSMFVVLSFVRAFGMWCFMIAFLHYGKKHFSYSSPTLQYGSEGSIAFYMLHQTVIVIIGYQIMDWQMGILPKFVILLIGTFVGILGIYELLIRRWNPVRFLFGMKAIKQET